MFASANMLSDELVGCLKARTFTLRAVHALHAGIQLVHLMLAWQRIGRVLLSNRSSGKDGTNSPWIQHVFLRFPASGACWETQRAARLLKDRPGRNCSPTLYGPAYMLYKARLHPRSYLACVPLTYTSGPSKSQLRRLASFLLRLAHGTPATACRRGAIALSFGTGREAKGRDAVLASGCAVPTGVLLSKCFLIKVGCCVACRSSLCAGRDGCLCSEAERLQSLLLQVAGPCKGTEHCLSKLLPLSNGASACSVTGCTNTPI